MAGNILSIGKTGLLAAQAGLATTGNNITNASVAGYSRQAVVQATALSIQSGYGFSGTGTKIAEIMRYSDSFLNKQVQTATASKSALDAFGTQIDQVDNLLSDTSAGLSPALQNFFAAVQNVTGNHASDSSRQGMFSAADTLAARFQSIADRLQEIRTGVDNQIRSNVTLINSYAGQIAQLNEQIGAFAGDPTRQPNDLLDKRDQLVLKLNEHIKATVTPGDNNSYTISIGNGMPLVVGKSTYKLTATTSPTDQSRVAIGYQVADRVTILSENALTGGELGGLLDFRANSLDKAQSSFGRIAVGLAMTFNEQHKLGVDQLVQQGKDVFSVGPPFIGKNINNNATSTTAVSAVITDPKQLTGSDYKIEYDGTDYWVIRLSDKNPTKVTTVPQSVDGIDFSVTGTAAANDNFLVRPTANAADGFKLLLTNPAQIAAAAPIATSAPATNKGSATISPGAVDSTYFTSPLGASVTLSFNSATGQLGGFPATQAVTVVASGVTTTYPAGTPVPFTAGASYSFGGMSFSISGAPQNGDTFTISKNTGLGDVRNAGLLAGLQTKNIFNNGNATYQSAYASLVSQVGNKAREVQVNAEAGEALLAQVTNAAQDVSGVNLDEEATNLLKYQQAYQAAGQIMQVASTVFDTLLAIGH
jgi:flagellar hook-associated protein 1